MAVQTPQHQLSEFIRDLTTIIDRLAADKNDLRLDLRNVKLIQPKAKFEMNGTVDFQIFHETPKVEKHPEAEQKNDAASVIPSVEGGQVILSAGDGKVLEIDLSSSNHINVNVEDKAFMKRLIAIRNDLTTLLPGTAKPENPSNPPSKEGSISAARSFAETLCSLGLTVTFSYKGQRVATVGIDAHPTLLQHITKTQGIAVNNILTAIRLII